MGLLWMIEAVENRIINFYSETGPRKKNIQCIKNFLSNSGEHTLKALVTTTRFGCGSYVS